MTKILGIGNALVDILAIFENDDILQRYNLAKGSMLHIDEATVKQLFDEIRENCEFVAGGSAANTISCISKLGVESAFIGKVGNDTIGNMFLEGQNKNGVKSIILKSDEVSGCSIILVSPDGERTMCTYLGAALSLSDKDLVISQFSDYSHLHIEGYLVQNHDLLRRALELAVENNMTISLDLSSYNIVEENREFLSEILHKYVDIVFANEDEAKAFTNEKAEDAVGILAKMCQIAVVKIGAKGSLVQKGDEFHRIGILPAKRIDATGAGDSYAAGFLYGLAKDMPIDKCAQIGTVIAGNTVQVLGPKLSDEAWNRIKLEIEDIKLTNVIN